MKVAWWVHYGLGLATGLAAFALYWTHAELVKHSEEVRVSAAAARAGAEKFGVDIPALAPPAPAPPQSSPSQGGVKSSN
jgi:hypothetical protein